MLSALVVKGSFFIVVRLWFDVMPGVPGLGRRRSCSAALGAAAIVVGSVVALRQARLKLLIAYSTLAQIGYLFLMFPLAVDAGSGQLAARRRAGPAASCRPISHATAKAAMFMAAGLIYAALGHDRIAGLARHRPGAARDRARLRARAAWRSWACRRAAPTLAKKLLLDAAAATGQWWWALVLQAGGFFTAGLRGAGARPGAAPPTRAGRAAGRPCPASGEATALALALCSLLLALPSLGVVGRDTLSTAFTAGELWSVLLLVAGGGLLAIALGPQPRVAVGGLAVAVIGATRRAAGAVAGVVERGDGALREWPLAGLSLLVLAIAFGATMLLGR